MNANDYKKILIKAYKDQELSVEDFEDTLMNFAKLIHFADLCVKESLIEQFKTKVDMKKENLNNPQAANSDLGAVRSSYSSELESLQKELKDAEYRYVYGKDIIEQNKANFDMMTILNKIRKLKGIEE